MSIRASASRSLSSTLAPSPSRRSIASRVDPEGVVADVDAAAGHPGAGPGTEVAEHQRPARGHVLEGEALGVGAVDEQPRLSSIGLLGLAAEHHVGAGEADAEARVGRALDVELAPLGAVGEGLADRAVQPLAVSPPCP